MSLDLIMDMLCKTVAWSTECFLSMHGAWVWLCDLPGLKKPGSIMGQSLVLDCTRLILGYNSLLLTMMLLPIWAVFKGGPITTPPTWCMQSTGHCSVLGAALSTSTLSNTNARVILLLLLKKPPVMHYMFVPLTPNHRLKLWSPA